jgi:hypothetical protein
VEFLLQKLDYIYNNPCQPKWNLSVLPLKIINSHLPLFMNCKM